MVHRSIGAELLDKKRMLLDGLRNVGDRLRVNEHQIDEIFPERNLSPIETLAWAQSGNNPPYSREESLRIFCSGHGLRYEYDRQRGEYIFEVIY
jgi:hypothetical protein